MSFQQWLENKGEFQPLYFGCANDDVGHYVQDMNGRREGRLRSTNPNAHFLINHDGQLTPKDSYKPYQAILHHFPQFSVLAFWDNTVDSRPGSNSMFLLPPGISEQEALNMSAQSFPHIWQRFKTPISVIRVEEHK